MTVFTRAACIRNALELEGHYCELHTAHTVFIDCMYWCGLLAETVHPYLQEEHGQKTRERQQMRGRQRVILKHEKSFIFLHTSPQNGKMVLFEF